MAAASLDWTMCDFAIWAAGAVTVTYGNLVGGEIGWQLSDSGAAAVFAGPHGSPRPSAAPSRPRWRGIAVDAGGLDALARTGQGVTGGRWPAGVAR